MIEIFPKCTQMICGHKCVGSVGERIKYVLDISKLSGKLMVCDRTAIIAKSQLSVVMGGKGKQVSLID